MQSTAKRKATDDPHDFVVVPSDQARVAPSDDELTDLLRAAARHHSESGNGTAPNRSGSAPISAAVDTTFRATAVNDDLPARGTTFGRRAMRAVAALLLAMGIGAAALTWQTFGYAAKKALVKWVPQFTLSTSLPLDKLGLGAKSAPADEASVEEATPAQAASSAQSAAENGTAGNAAANPAASSSDPAQLLQSMARDLANVSQEVELLKASIAELKASQQQTTRDLVKVPDKASEQNAKAKVVTTPPRPAVVAVRKPAPIYSPTPTPAPPPPAYRPTPSYSAATQAAVAPPSTGQPYVPPPISLQPQAEPGFASAPRPPMPVQ